MGEGLAKDDGFDESVVRAVLLYTQPVVVSVHELKHSLGLACIRQLRVVQLSSVAAIIGSVLEPSSDGVIFKFKHAGPGRGVPVEHLLKEKEDGRLVGGL